MPLASGTRLGNYEIVAPLGKGGMGEVFRARDTKLGREVAVKVLPAAFAANPERLARFEREAKVLASLNHPNIATIYAVEESPEGKALIMELVPGASLAGPVSLDLALKYATQIASALEAAHEKGITHRDLKPANIMLTPDGVIKVLDFGLAAVTQPANEESADPNATLPTLTMSPTQAGMILGTAPYMSPEQARGQTVDRRTDIWAFGVVLWELLTGKRLFQGSDLTETLAFVVTKDPDLTQVPVDVHRLLTRCLQKDPKLRLKAIGDFELLLGTTETKGPTHARSKLAWMWATAATLVAIGAVSWIATRPVPSRPAVLRFAIDPPKGSNITTSAPNGPQMAVSPDGRSIAYIADTDGRRQLWVRALDSVEAQRLDRTDNAILPFWSPDSKNIAYFADNALFRIPISGGSPLRVCDAQSPDGGDWGLVDGVEVILFGSTDSETPIQRVAASGGVPQAATTNSPGERQTYPQFLPDGKRFFYLGRGGENSGIFVKSLSSGAPTFLMETPGRALFVSNRLLYLRDNTLIAQQIDWSANKPVGEPLVVVDGVRSGLGNGRNAFSASQNGILSYRTNFFGNGTRHRWYSRAGKPGIATELGNNLAAELSPDGKRAAITTGLHLQIWILDTATGALSQATNDAYNAGDAAAWSPDAKRLVYQAVKGINQTVVGSGTGSLVYASGVPLQWLRSGILIRDKGAIELLPAPPEGSSQPVTAAPKVLTRLSVDQVQVSPDEKWVAYSRQAGASRDIWIAAFPSFASPRKVAKGEQPRWRGDGRELFLYTDPTGISAVDVKVENDLATGVPHVVLSTPTLAIGSGTFFRFDVARDAQSFLVRERDQAVAVQESLQMIVNWPSLLSK